jgi:hypothetical protein
MTRLNRAIARHVPASKRLVTLFALLTFAFQAYLVQTHIHVLPAPVVQAVHHVAVTHAGKPGTPTPSDPYDPAKCPLCQEMLHAGAAITPAAPPLLLLLNWVATAESVSLVPAMAIAPETGWQSRAPPRR